MDDEDEFPEDTESDGEDFDLFGPDDDGPGKGEGGDWSGQD